MNFLFQFFILFSTSFLFEQITEKLKLQKKTVKEEEIFNCHNLMYVKITIELRLQFWSFQNVYEKKKLMTYYLCFFFFYLKIIVEKFFALLKSLEKKGEWKKRKVGCFFVANKVFITFTFFSLFFLALFQRHKKRETTEKSSTKIRFT